MAMFLFDVQEKNRLKQKGLLQRFSMFCLGKQSSLEEIRSEKAEKYKELKDNKDSPEYDEWFLKYNPNVKRRHVSNKKHKQEKMEFIFSEQANNEKKKTSSPKLPKVTYKKKKNKKYKKKFGKKTFKNFLF
jgi:hypothetical protein